MYLIFNTLTKEFDPADTPHEAQQTLQATQEWLEEQRAYHHQVQLYKLERTEIVKEEVV